MPKSLETETTVKEIEGSWIESQQFWSDKKEFYGEKNDWQWEIKA
jgi:hypothetical protein